MEVILRENPAARISAVPSRTEIQRDLYRVRIIDNDYNTYEQVIRICMKALHITYSEGLRIALAVDHNGYADVFEGTRSEAESIADVIRTIGIEVQVLKVS